MKNIVLFTSILGIITLSCNNKCVFKENFKEETFFLEDNINNSFLLDKFISKKTLNTIVLDNNLLVFIDYGVSDEKKEENWIFYIKEINSKSINRHIYVSNNRIFSHIPDYDSIYKDKELLHLGYYSDFWKTIEKKDHTNYTKIFSENFYKLPEIRKNSNDYQEECEKDTSYVQIEKIINELKHFKKFSFNDIHKVDLLKKILELTQISILSIDPNDIETDYSYINNAFRCLDIYEISNSKDFITFKNLINEETSLDIDENMVKFRWLKQNKEFLKTKLLEIEKDYSEQNIFYFYTCPDLKLIKFNIKINKDGSINIEKYYINKEYLWFHYKNAILTPKFLY